MLKSCQYCGRIHDSKIICEEKESTIKMRRRKKYNNIERFRGTKAWKDKRQEIKERDSCTCQICIRGLYDPERIFETEDLSVHHAIPIEQDYNKRLDNDNLITGCEKHHEMMEDGTIPYEIVRNIIDEQEAKVSIPPGVCTLAN